METKVIDTSVLIKWFIKEVKRESALELRDSYLKGEINLIAPDLILYELLNALKYIKLHNEEEMKTIFETIMNYDINLHYMDKELAEEAIKLAKNSELTIYDSSYLALAKLMDGKLITADEKLIKNSPKEYKKYVKGL
ncbi:MAG: type II toxin-antitoxin system VapC family toxin [Candidatus Heimdallarchaeaceae archaeon]